MNAAELSQRMSDNAAAICSYLLPQGKKAGPEWKAGSTTGEPGQSLSVRLTGAKAGVWKDFASGEAGDLLDLWAACRGQSMSEAINDAKQYLGIHDAMPAREEKAYKRPAKPQCQTPKSRVREWLSSRGLEERTIAAWKIGEQVHGGKVYAVFPYLRDGELVNVKYRNPDDKRDMRQEGGAEPCLFGWHLIAPRARTVAITEGEIDAMTLWQAGIPALSVNAGAGNHQWIESDWERLERFSEILVAFDSDEAGEKGAKEVIRRLGVMRCKRLTFPAKDANQWLMDGAGGEDFQHAAKDAKPQDPEELRQLADFMGRVKAMFYPTDGQSTDPVLRLDQSLDWFEFRQGELTVWTGYNGHGKALSLDTPIPTPTGWTTMGELAAGDQVFDENGIPCNVVAATDVMTDRPCYRVEFNDGTQIVADANHEWLTHTAVARTSWRNARDNDRLAGRDLSKRGNDQSHKRAMPSVITTREMAATLLVAEKSHFGTTNHSIPVCGPLALPDATLPVDPYVLGAWLGDGNSNSAAITSDDPEIIEHIAKTGVTISKRTAKYLYGLNGGLQTALRLMGLLNNKHIPAQYMRASFAQRLALLQGLMDTDGHITSYGRCEFTSVLKPLADQVLELVLSCGVQARMIEGRATLNGKDCGAKYRITFTPQIPVFRLTRKAACVRAEVSCRIRHRFVVACEPVASVPVRCIQVDSASSLYLASRAMIPTHNSLLLSQVEMGLMQQGERLCVFSGEMTPERQLKRMVKQASGLDRPTSAYLDAIGEWMHDRIWVFNLVGSAGIDRLLDVFEYANKRYGVRHFVIDSLMMTDVPEDGPGSISEQKKAIQKLCNFAKRNGCHIHLVAHPRKGKDESGVPGKMDVGGAGKITDGADNVFSVWSARRDESDPITDDPDAKLELQKQRNGDVQHKTLALWFVRSAQQFATSSRRRPISYVEFSGQPAMAQS